MKEKTEQIIYDIHIALIYLGLGFAILGMGLSLFAVGYFILTGK